MINMRVITFLLMNNQAMMFTMITKIIFLRIKIFNIITNKVNLASKIVNLLYQDRLIQFLKTKNPLETNDKVLKWWTGKVR